MTSWPDKLRTIRCPDELGGFMAGTEWQGLLTPERRAEAWSHAQARGWPGEAISQAVQGARAWLTAAALALAVLPAPGGAAEFTITDHGPHAALRVARAKLEAAE